MTSKQSRSRRSPCPIACTLDLVGDRWTLLVVRDLLRGREQFKDLAASPEGIATNILSQRLTRLVDAGFAERAPSPDHAGRFLYRLTARGAALEPLLEAISQWGLRHLPGTEARLHPDAGPAPAGQET